MHSSNYKMNLLYFSYVIIFLAFLLPFSVFGQETTTNNILIPGQDIKGIFKESKVHQYKIFLEKGTYFQANIMNENTPIFLKLLNKNNEELINNKIFQLEDSVSYQRNIAFIATVSEYYYLEVSLAKFEPIEVIYQISNIQKHVATNEEKLEFTNLISSQTEEVKKELARTQNKLKSIEKNQQSTLTNKKVVAQKKIYKKQINRLINNLIIKNKIAFQLIEGSDGFEVLGQKVVLTHNIASYYYFLEIYPKAVEFYRLSLKFINSFEKNLSEQLDSVDDLSNKNNKNLSKYTKQFKTRIISDLAFSYVNVEQEENSLYYLNQIDFDNTELWENEEEETKDFLKDSLNLFAALLVSVGDIQNYQKSINNFKTILNNYKKYGLDRESEMTFRLNLGKAYIESGLYSSAYQQYNKSLKISKDLQKELANSKESEKIELRKLAIKVESILTNNFGILYLRSGNLAAAEIYVSDAYNQAKNQKDKLNTLQWKANLGAVFVRQKKYNVALKYFKETIPQLLSTLSKYSKKYQNTRNIDDKITEREQALFLAITTYYQGKALRETNNIQKAIITHKNSINIGQKYNFKKFEARARIELGLDYLSLKKADLALAEFERAFQLAKAVNARDEQIAAYDGLMRAWQAKDNSKLAIIYGKKSISFLQQTREELKKIGETIASEFVKDNENTYRFLANILISEGRLREAHTVLDLLKIEEYKELTPKRGKAQLTIKLSDDEDEILKIHSEIVIKSRRKRELEKKLRSKCGNLKENPKCRLTDEEENEIARIDSEIKFFNEKYNVLITNLKNNHPQLDERLSKIQTDLKNFNRENNSATVYTVVGNNPEKYNENGNFGWVILITNDVINAYPVNTKGLNKNIFNLQKCLQTNDFNPEKYSKMLYERIFRQKSESNGKTLEEDLNEYFKGVDSKVIMWSLDGVLRNVPMAVLHDGKQYLVEKYLQTVINPHSVVHFNKKDSNIKRILGFGVTEQKIVDGEVFRVIKEVRKELDDSIIQNEDDLGIFPGEIKINDEFISAEAKMLIRRQNYSILHFATHYKFFENEQLKSFLVTGNGKITLEELVHSNLFSSVDTLIFSACETLVSGNEKEIEGLVSTSQHEGAKTVVASLWRVSDQGTPELMIQFYKNLRDYPNLTKGEAFRQAQISLLNGYIKGENSAKKKTKQKKEKKNSCRGGGICPGNADNKEIYEKFPESEKKFKHPHYWSSFVIAGNWR